MTSPDKQSFVVLHVEDDEELLRSMAMLLRAHGYETRSAADGTDALAQVTRRGCRPDVLIVDFDLPGNMDGADIAEGVARALGYPVPTIVLSGKLSATALPWLPAAPLFCAWKPVDPQILLKTVESFAILGRFIQARVRSQTRSKKTTEGSV